MIFRTMTLSVIKKHLSRLFENVYFTFGRDTFTDDPADGVVKLRDRLVALVEGKVGEVNGSTTAGEHYVLTGSPGDRHYALAHIRREQILRYTNFAPGWPGGRQGDYESRVAIQTPLIIEGNPFRITKDTAEPTKVVLKVDG